MSKEKDRRKGNASIEALYQATKTKGLERYKQAVS